MGSCMQHDDSPLGLPCCPSIHMRDFRPSHRMYSSNPPQCGPLGHTVHCSRTVALKHSSLFIQRRPPPAQEFAMAPLAYKTSATAACHLRLASLLWSPHSLLLQDVRSFSLTSCCALFRHLHPREEVLMLQDSAQMLPSLHSLLRFF